MNFDEYDSVYYNQFTGYLLKLYWNESLKDEARVICNNKIYNNFSNRQFRNIKYNFTLTEV